MKSFNMHANEKLFELIDIYKQGKVEFDNCLGENILGKLILNRVENIAYMKLKQNNCSMGIYEKYFASLYKRAIDEVNDYENGLAYVCKIMEQASFKFALLKGAFLIPIVYEKGFRYSNDIDILIAEQDIDVCQKLLKDNGFIQGYVIDGEVHKVARREIVLSRMNYGETIPFCKVLKNKIVCVDINFSLDYKPMLENKIIQSMLECSIVVRWKNSVIKTLNISDFIIHLCMHLYKEATIFDWVKRRKDLNLYKFNDLNVVFHECVTDDTYKLITERIVCYGVQRECYYALLYASMIFSSLADNKRFKKLLNDIKPDNINYLSKIYDPQRKKTFTYNMSFEEWFACENRIDQLIEVTE